MIFDYLVVNRNTAFEIDWLWQQTLHILHGHSNFNAVTLSFNGNVFDIFQSLINSIEEKIKIKKNNENISSFRIIADHLRSISFLIADGVIPSNEG